MSTKSVISLSWAENLSFPPKIVNQLSKFSAQESNLTTFVGNETKVKKKPSEIKSPLASNHQPSYNNDPLHRCCLGTSWRRSSMALWNEVLFTKDPKAISSQQLLLSRILARYYRLVTWPLWISLRPNNQKVGFWTRFLRLVGRMKIHGGNLKLTGHVTSLIPCKNSSLLLLTDACVQCSVPACAFCYFLSLSFE